MRDADVCNPFYDHLIVMSRIDAELLYLGRHAGVWRLALPALADKLTNERSSWLADYAATYFDHAPSVWPGCVQS